MPETENRTLTRRGVLKHGIAAATVGIAATSISEWTVAENPTKTNLPRYGFLIDVEKCMGCFACAVACKEEFDVPLGVFRSQVITQEKGKFPKVKRLFLPWLCNHCKNPICIEQCPVEPKNATYISPEGKEIHYQKRATYQRPDGIVMCDNGLIDTPEDRCIGCGICVKRCPYQVRFITSQPDGQRANKCNLCVHRLEKGDKPACVKACPHEARIVGDLNDPESNISNLLAEYKSKGKDITVLPSTRNNEEDKNTEPLCFYVGLNKEELFEVYENGECVKDEAKG
jgi:tetrathionate reductase subunit B